jgi:hypothetical protein
VDTTNEWMARADGCLATQVFTPHTVGDDGFTMSIWRDDAAMLGAAYSPGFHRSQIARLNGPSAEGVIELHARRRRSQRPFPRCARRVMAPSQLRLSGEHLTRYNALGPQSMALFAGTRLGSYEITAQTGASGTGKTFTQTRMQAMEDL